MNLEELKTVWTDGNSSISDNQKLSNSTITKITQKRFKSQSNKIAIPELIGIAICLLSALFIAFNFNRLGTLPLQFAAVSSIVLLIALSVISWLSLKSLEVNLDINQSYAENLKSFASQKIHFIKLQKWNVYLSYPLLVAVILLLSKFIDSDFVIDLKLYWIYSFSFGYLFLLSYSNWVTKYYKTTLDQSEELLREIKECLNT